MPRLGHARYSAPLVYSERNHLSLCWLHPKFRDQSPFHLFGVNENVICETGIAPSQREPIQPRICTVSLLLLTLCTVQDHFLAQQPVKQHQAGSIKFLQSYCSTVCGKFSAGPSSCTNQPGVIPGNTEDFGHGRHPPSDCRANPETADSFFLQTSVFQIVQRNSGKCHATSLLRQISSSQSPPS